MSIQITLSANAGVSITIGNTRLWVDALHQTAVNGFSTLSQEQVKSVFASEAFAAPQAVIFTHCHPDHYHKSLVRKAVNLWPETKLILPQQEFDRQVLLQADDETIPLAGVNLHFMRLMHEKEEFHEVPHYGLEIFTPDCSILIPGDSAVASPKLYEWIQGKQYRLALFNFPWVTLKKGRSFIEENLQTEQLLIYHLPFAEQDTEHYRRAASIGCDQLKSNIKAELFCDFMRTVNID